MEIVKAFNENNLHTEIVIKGTYEEPLFRANDIGEILEMSNIRSHVQHFDKSEKVVNTIDTLGGSQQVTFLTEKGLYKVLFKSRKPIAEKFQNWICEVIKEIRLNGVYDLQKQLEKQKKGMQLLEENKNKEMEEKIIKEKGLEREKILLTKFSNSGNLIYIIRVKTYSNCEYVVKIGHSDYGVKARYDECKGKQFEECLLLDCFPVQKSRNFETFIHNHSKISCNNIKLDTHKTETELFLIGKDLTYSILLDIINKNIQKYNQNNNTKEILELECQKLQLIDSINNSNSYIQEILNTNKILLEKMALLEKQNQEILNKLNSQQTKVVTGFNQQMPHLGPRLQQINPETLKLIKVYESVTEAMNENKNIKRPSIMKSVEENSIYCGFRWLLVERNLDPNIIHDIKPTKETKVQNLGYIAKLDANKTEILNVYLDRKTASQLNGYQSSSALDNHVKNSTLTNGNYYILYDNCEYELIQKFEEIHGEPLLYKNGIGQFDINNNLVREFACKYDVIRELKMSDKTLAKSLLNNIPYNNFYYKELGSKLKCL
jgi:prophage antirepressor-like protein